MKKQLLKYLYQRYAAIFQDIIIEDTLIDHIPKVISDNAISFLKKNRKNLEPWLTHQAYYFQKKFLSVDKSDTNVWKGCLFLIKVLFMVTAQGKVIAEDEQALSDIPSKTEEKPLFDAYAIADKIKAHKHRSKKDEKDLTER